MFVLAVTGGIGAGKSEAARYFASLGAVVLDLDAIAKGVVRAPGPVHDRVVGIFGPAVFGADGSVDTAALARLAFSSEKTTRALDAIVHPAVLSEVMVGLAELDLLERPPRVVVLDVPLLVEAPALAEIADAVLAISAPEDVRIARCVARGMAEEDARARLARQATDDERAGMADTVIASDGDIEAFHAALQGFWARKVAPNVA